MAYQVTVVWAPAHELLVSLQAYLDRSNRNVLELPSGWAQDAAGCLPAGFADQYRAVERDLPCAADRLLAFLCPEQQDVSGFLVWLSGLSPGELYEGLATHMPESGRALPSNLGALRDRWVALLQEWNRCYYSRLDPAIGEGLAREAESRRGLLRCHPPDLQVEEATGGLVLEPGLGLERVVLVPQHHMRPFNLNAEMGSTRLILYPADVAPADPDALSPGLRRLTSALSEESRLRILRFLAAGPRTFTEIVEACGLAKSTVHHHMVILRSAGLVRVHMSASGTDRYSLRSGALSELGTRLAAYIEGA